MTPQRGMGLTSLSYLPSVWGWHIIFPWHAEQVPSIMFLVTYMEALSSWVVTPLSVL